mgnify:CR=1 FL=1
MKYTFTQKDFLKSIELLEQDTEKVSPDWDKILSEERIRRTKYKKFLRSKNNEKLYCNKRQESRTD